MSIEVLERKLREQGTKLIYLPETSSTMDVATGMESTVIVTDHQTAGKGRYSRRWEDVPGSSLLATFTKSLPKEALPPQGSLLLSHLFVLAIWRAIDQPSVSIKWPNDLMLDGKKLGGVLLAEGDHDGSRQSISFGVGINLTGNDTNVAYLNADRDELVIAINHTLDLFLADISRLDTYYNDLWQQASYLVGEEIRVTHFGPHGDQTIKGTVQASPFGGYLQLILKNGAIIDMKDYGHQAHIETIETIERP